VQADRHTRTHEKKPRLLLQARLWQLVPEAGIEPARP